jgi:hypothetical protein
VHGFNHQNLAALPYDQAVDEIEQSVERVKSRLGCDLNAFAYAGGQLEDQRRDLNDIFIRIRLPYVFTTFNRTMRYSKFLSKNNSVIHIPRISFEAQDSACVFREKVFGYWDYVANVQWLRSCIRTRSLRPHAKY